MTAYLKVPMAWKTDNGWKIPKDFFRDQMEFNQPGFVEFGWKGAKGFPPAQIGSGSPPGYEAVTCRITDRDDARRTYGLNHTTPLQSAC